MKGAPEVGLCGSLFGQAHVVHVEEQDETDLGVRRRSSSQLKELLPLLKGPEFVPRKLVQAIGRVTNDDFWERGRTCLKKDDVIFFSGEKKETYCRLW